MSFAEHDLARIRTAEEVEIETQAPDGPVHRTVIWAVVDGGDTFIRSYRGPDARWFREALANPAVALRLDDRRMAATAIAATDPDSVERASAGFRQKYGGDPAARSMAEQHHETTLRLEPA
jgi:hypothetical protein